ncbi:hypothetical protein I79_014264 [Cricetulus griseus]|uniref:Uncharacterized protein n=1 Tax=Cricetulus griseus TaxID=10029 RepID=G3HTN6_CRIGR|nr:hypothetical protein I79_014264 [Cricetulus griseus]
MLSSGTQIIFYLRLQTLYLLLHLGTVLKRSNSLLIREQASSKEHYSVRSFKHRQTGEIFSYTKNTATEHTAQHGSAQTRQ